MANEKKCLVCGQGYKYCGHCDKNAKQNRWKLNYCSENCRDIFKTVMEYVGGSISIADAKDRLVKLNLDIKIGDSVSTSFAKIMQYKKPEKKTVEKEETKPEVTEEVAEKPQPVRKPRKRRPKKIEE